MSSSPTLEKTFPHTPYDQVSYLSFNCHRDERGNDWLYSDGLSIGQILAGPSQIAFASLYREHYRAKRVSAFKETHSSLESDTNHFKSRSSINISNNVSHSPSSNPKQAYFNWPREREHINIPGYGFKSTVASIIQRPILYYVRQRKHIYLSDWTLKKCVSRDHNGLLINSRNIFSGAYFRFKRESISDSERRFPENIRDIVTPDKISEALTRRNYQWNRDLIELCCKYLISYYDRNRPLFVKTFALYKELFSRYEPSCLSVPGELYEPYTIAFQLAKRLGIVSRLIPDGYVILSYYPTLLDHLGREWLIDRFCAYGQASFDNFTKRGVDASQCDMMPFPVLDRHIGLRSSSVYDLIIMTWIPMNLDPECSLDASPHILRVALMAARASGLRKIAVKAKSDREISYVRAVLEDLGLAEEVHILSGYFFEHVCKTRAVIGGISTGIVEALHHDIPYYVFEPRENGYSDEMINSSSLLKREYIARTASELIEMLENRVPSCRVPKEYVFHKT